jgi:hypothetical protein
MLKLIHIESKDLTSKIENQKKSTLYCNYKQKQTQCPGSKSEKILSVLLGWQTVTLEWGYSQCCLVEKLTAPVARPDASPSPHPTGPWAGPTNEAISASRVKYKTKGDRSVAYPCNGRGQRALAFAPQSPGTSRPSAHPLRRPSLRPLRSLRRMQGNKRRGWDTKVKQ